MPTIGRRPEASAYDLIPAAVVALVLIATLIGFSFAAKINTAPWQVILILSGAEGRDESFLSERGFSTAPECQRAVDGIGQNNPKTIAFCVERSHRR